MTETKLLLRLAVLAACLVLPFAAPSVAKDAYPAEIAGWARIVDGDTLEIDAHKIRLAGMDAPENEQVCRDDADKVYRCGRSATEALGRIVAGQSLVCRITGTDRYRRLLVQCSTPRTADIGLETSATEVRPASAPSREPAIQDSGGNSTTVAMNSASLADQASRYV
jgi:endonuclease YncB( thermonuclease family)